MNTLDTLQFYDIAKSAQKFGLNLKYTIGVRYYYKNKKPMGLYYICAKNENHKETYLVKSYFDNINIELAFLQEQLNATIIDICIKDPNALKTIVENM